MTERNGVEYLSTCGGLYMDSAAAEPLFGGASSWSTIQADGYARWYQVGSAGGQDHDRPGAGARRLRRL